MIFTLASILYGSTTQTLTNPSSPALANKFFVFFHLGSSSSSSFSSALPLVGSSSPPSSARNLAAARAGESVHHATWLTSETPWASSICATRT